MPLGSFSKDKLVFDPTAPLDSDNIGAWVRSADGDIITDHELMEAEYAGLISQGLIFRSKLPGAIGNTYSFQVVDTTPGAISFTEVAGAIIVDLHNNTPTKAQVATLLSTSAYADVSVGTPASGNVVVAGTQSFVNGEDHSYHHHLDVYSATADGYGNPITSTAGALDVNVKSPITIDTQLEGIYNAGTNPNPDNVGVIAHTRGASQGDAQQVERTTAAAPSADNVASTDVKGLDVNAFGMVWDSTGGNWDRMPGNSTSGVLVNVSNTVSIAGDIADDDPDGTSKPLKVGSRSEWGALAALSANNDRADLVSDKYRRIYVNNGSNIGLRQASVTAGAAEVELKSGASRLDGRRLLMLQNLSNKEVYVGKTGVTSTAGANAGIVLAARASMSLDVGQDVAVFVLGSTTGQDIRVLEMA